MPGSRELEAWVLLDTLRVEGAIAAALARARYQRGRGVRVLARVASSAFGDVHRQMIYLVNFLLKYSYSTVTGMSGAKIILSALRVL